MPPVARPRGPLTWEELREQLGYNEKTGWLVWLVSKPRVKGARVVEVCGEKWLEHRLIWFWMKGSHPPRNMYIDHKNRIRSDNRWENLRLATHGQNYVNSSQFGVMRGIHHRGGEKYRVKIGYMGKTCSQQVIGLENAIKLRREMELAYYGEFTCER